MRRQNAPPSSSEASLVSVVNLDTLRLGDSIILRCESDSIMNATHSSMGQTVNIKQRQNAAARQDKMEQRFYQGKEEKLVVPVTTPSYAVVLLFTYLGKGQLRCSLTSDTGRNALIRPGDVLTPQANTHIIKPAFPHHYSLHQKDGQQRPDVVIKPTSIYRVDPKTTSGSVVNAQAFFRSIVRGLL